MYAVVRDTPLSWDDYRLIAIELGADVPEGLLIKVAGRTAEGVRVIELWRDRDHFARYDRELLDAARARTPSPLVAETVRELVVEHLLQPGERRSPAEVAELGADRSDKRTAPAAGRHTNQKGESC
jgi:hypothetical protein